VDSSASAIVIFDEGRRQPRTHLFVAAILYSGGRAAPVRIRNMSPSGALLEGAGIAEAGTAVTLKRGSLEAFGVVAWSADLKAGIAFSGPVEIASWMSRKPPSHQARVDDIVAEIRTGQPRPDHGKPATKANGAGSLETELAQLRADLSRLCGMLANDPALIAAHPEIQMFDVSVQRIDRIIGQLGGDT
jgi:hypothetical protein